MPYPFLRWIFHFLYTIFYNHNEYSIATVCNIHIFSSWVLFFGTIWIHPCFMKLSVNRSLFLDRDSKITSDKKINFLLQKDSRKLFFRLENNSKNAWENCFLPENDSKIFFVARKLSSRLYSSQIKRPKTWLE